MATRNGCVKYVGNNVGTIRDKLSPLTEVSQDETRVNVAAKTNLREGLSIYDLGLKQRLFTNLDRQSIELSKTAEQIYFKDSCV